MTLARRTPLGRGSKKLSRRTPLANTNRPPRGRTVTGPATGTAQPRRRGPVTKPAAATGPTPTTRALVLERDGHRCVRCGGTLEGPFGYSLQHRIGRGAGGRFGETADLLNSPANLIALCGSGTTGCHGWVEANPALADQYGWSVPSWADPASWPVLYPPHDWALITAIGTTIPLDNDALTADEYPGIRRLTDPPPPI